MVKTILAVLIAAVPAGAAEFGLNRAEIPALRELPVAEAPAPAPALPAGFTDRRGTEMNCVSAYDPEGSVAIAFDPQWGMLDRISLEGRPMWQYDGGVTDYRSVHQNGKDLIARSGFLQALLKKAGATAAYDSANLTLSAKGFYPTPEAALAKIEDDGAGIVYVDLLKDGRPAGTALFAGWGGIFKDCRPAVVRHGAKAEIALDGMEDRNAETVQKPENSYMFVMDGSAWETDFMRLDGFYANGTDMDYEVGLKPAFFRHVQVSLTGPLNLQPGDAFLFSVAAEGDPATGAKKLEYDYWVKTTDGRLTGWQVLNYSVRVEYVRGGPDSINARVVFHVTPR